MNLTPAPFLAIKRGTKTIEMRLFDEKRQKIKQGDTVCFSNIQTGEKLYCLVTAIYRYKNFEQLYAMHDKISIGYAANETANPNDMLSYYSLQDILKYGVVGIEIKVI